MRGLRYVSFLLMSLIGLALAHATLVLGTVESSPALPAAGEPFTLSLGLEDVTELPVEDAFVLAEFRPQEGEGDSAEPITAEFEEAGTGTYIATATLPEPGPYTLRLRDQTFRQEEAVAELTFHVGEGEANELSFVFPPTETGSQNPWLWILALGLPILAAAVVTAVVLLRTEEPETASR